MTLIDLLERAVTRFGDRPALGLRSDDGSGAHWSYRDLDRRARIAAWRLRALDLEPGDRILTWSPSSPELPAAYFGAMHARLVIVPLDLRMSTDAVATIVRASGARHLILGTGRDAPDPAAAGLADFPTTTVEALSAEPAADDPLFPPDWEARQAAWKRPEPDEVFQLIFTSGTTGTPKGVMLAHDNVAASIESFHHIVPPMEHRLVSLLPLSHLLEQAVGLYYALDVGADILYVRSRNPRVIFDALREHRVTSMVVVPQVLDLFWSAIEREIDKRGRRATVDRLRGVARHLPFAVRRLLFRSVHAQLGGHFRLFLSSGAFLPPSLQQAWEDLGVTVLQGYGATETGTGACTTLDDHGPGTVGRTPEGIQMRIVEGGEIQFRGRSVFKGYWNAPELTAQAFTDDGWYRTGDLGHFDAGRPAHPQRPDQGHDRAAQRLQRVSGGHRERAPHRRHPRRRGRRDGTRPDRGGRARARRARRRMPFGARVGAAVKAANASLGPNQRIAGWRQWPDEDFPRTHTLKVKRDPVRRWAAAPPAGPRTTGSAPRYPGSRGRAGCPAAARRRRLRAPTSRGRPSIRRAA